MAYATQVLLDGPRHHVILLTGRATDTTGENNVVKVDRSGLSGTPTDVVVEEITASVQGFESVQLYWEHSGGDELIAELSGESYYDFRPEGGLHQPTATAAATDGDITLVTYSGSTAGSAVAGDTYYIKLVLKKTYG